MACIEIIHQIAANFYEAANAYSYVVASTTYLTQKIAYGPICVGVFKEIKHAKQLLNSNHNADNDITEDGVAADHCNGLYWIAVGYAMLASCAAVDLLGASSSFFITDLCGIG